MLRLQTKSIKFNLPSIPTSSQDEWFRICHLNTRGYLHHISDIKADSILCSADVICFTETHLWGSDIILQNSKPAASYIPFRCDRSSGTEKGGILTFGNPWCNPMPLNLQIQRLEFAGIVLSPTADNILVIITIYRRAKTLSIERFLVLIEDLLSHDTLQEKDVMVLGDFNEDQLDGNTRISDFFLQYGFIQLIQEPTINQGSLLDHIYYNNTTKIAVTEVCDTYYSDHDLVNVVIRKDDL